MSAGRSDVLCQLRPHVDDSWIHKDFQAPKLLVTELDHFDLLLHDRTDSLL
jgi:hypothetical protein